ncbi:MAG TPA: hypothetical protein VFR94_13275 [Nitrososphaeraceae archaeon]|nr:hypothetical protein [Nitrososphaeraceae archaeon]
MELTCKTGQNSPATRPEFVDLSLNATGDGVQQATVEEETEEGEEDVEDEANGDGEGEGEANDVSPGVPPTG